MPTQAPPLSEIDTVYTLTIFVGLTLCIYPFEHEKGPAVRVWWHKDGYNTAVTRIINLERGTFRFNRKLYHIDDFIRLNGYQQICKG